MSRNPKGGFGAQYGGLSSQKAWGLPMRGIADYFRHDSVSLCQRIAKVERRIGEESGFREIHGGGKEFD